VAKLSDLRQLFGVTLLMWDDSDKKIILNNKIINLKRYYHGFLDKKRSS